MTSTTPTIAASPLTTEPPAAAQSASRLLAAALAALVFLVYFPVIRAGGFIWDDPQYVVGNRLLRSIGGLAAIWLHPSQLPQYYPLVHTTFWIEYHLVGLSPRLYHIDNILLHALAAILLWQILRRLRIPGAFLAAAIFAVHPVNVESVAWITERKNVLSLVFYLLALRSYLNFLDKPAISAWTLAFAFFLCALLSKSVTCSLPAAILLILFFRAGRLRRADILPLIPFFTAGLVMAVVTSWLEKSHVGASGPEWNFTFSDRCLIAGRALWFYATKILCPHPLIFIYPRWRHMSLPQCPALILFPLAAITVVIALWLLRKRLGRGPLVAVLFFAGTLLPALGFINLYPMRYSFVADHFQYHACIGLIVLAAAALRKIPAPASTALAAIIIAILGFLTWRQGPIYHNQLTLWQDVVQHNPTSWMAQGNLGDEYAALSNRTDLPADQQHEYRRQAVACYAELYRLAPEQPLAHLKWGIVKEYDGDLAAAENEFNQSLRLAPTFTIAMNSLGMLMMRQHRTDEALAWYRKAVALDPGYAEARVNFGDALLATGDEDAAFAQYAQAAAVRPDNVEAQFKLGNMLLLDQHNPVEATYHYLAALASDPTRADIWVNLSAAFLERGNLDEAREDCGQALRLDPNLPQAKQLWQELERR